MSRIPENISEITFDVIIIGAGIYGAGLAGTSSGRAHIESMAGIDMGGRTGLTSVFTARCFLLCASF